MIAISMLATAASAMAQAPASHGGDIPQTIRLDHEPNRAAQHKTPGGAVAAKALVPMEEHHEKKLEFIFPSLTVRQSLRTFDRCRPLFSS